MNSATLAQQKQKYRKQIQEALKTLSPEEIARQSSIITKKALLLPEYQNAQSVSIFLSMPGKEVATEDIVKQAFKDGKMVYVPYIHASKDDPKLKIMDMLRLQDEHDLRSLKPDAWGIPSLSKESTGERENALGGKGCLEDASNANRESKKLDLIFMPSMGFDSSLNRLGHGKGFYDRYLSLCQSFSTASGLDTVPRLVGLALKEQILSPGEVLPTNEQDWKVDCVVTSEA